jgi:hypothetical protein
MAESAWKKVAIISLLYSTQPTVKRQLLYYFLYFSLLGVEDQKNLQTSAVLI